MDDDRDAALRDPGGTSWGEENMDDLRVSVSAESERLQEILLEIQALSSLPAATKRARLDELINTLQHSASKEELQQLLDSVDGALNEFIGDPRRFVACISQIFSCIDNDADRTHVALQRFVQDKQIGQVYSPAPFDWTMVDILLSQLSHLAGSTAIFTQEMRESIIFSLFSSNGECHFLQDLVSQFLMLSVGEQISVVRKRMRSLSQATLSKVTLLSNMVIEIHEKYEKEMDELRPIVDDEDTQ